MTQEEKAKAYDEALTIAKRIISKNCSEVEKLCLKSIFPELAESEDERTRKWLLDYAIEMIAGLESDISLSNYDGIKGHDPEAEAELAQWQKARAYLEKQKEPHYTKRNALFDKCVENCDPEIMQRVSDEVDEMLQKEQKPAGWSEEHIACIFEKVGLAKIVREQGNDDLTNAVQSAMLELSKVENTEWSEEDRKMLDDCIMALSNWRDAVANYGHEVVPCQKLIDWLKSLRPQSKKELSIEKAIQWLDDTFYFLNNSSGRGRDCEITTHDFDSLEEMYDSFRKAVTVDSEPSWKPSEEQMESLAYAIQVLNSNPHPKSAKAYQDLQTLYKNIKYGN